MNTDDLAKSVQNEISAREMFQKIGMSVSTFINQHQNEGKYIEAHALKDFVLGCYTYQLGKFHGAHPELAETKEGQS